MNNKNKLWSIVMLMATILSIVAALSVIGFEKLFPIDWNIMGWIFLSVLFFSILAVVYTILLIKRRNRLLKIYVSYPLSHEQEVIKLNEALKGEVIISAENLPVGVSMNELAKVIKHCNVCLLAVGKTPSPMQKEELKIMRALGKKVYIISLDEEGKVPQILRGEVPLFINEEGFEKRIRDILMSHK